MNKFKALAVCGMLSPGLYPLLWILGSVLVPEYSLVRNDVSSLMAVGAYNYIRDIDPAGNGPDVLSTQIGRRMEGICCLLISISSSGFDLGNSYGAVYW
ncbi:MAG: hypothetical protein E4H36_07430 [Spirochaetales bacterium]|nr:MAG: hypothetical protein E4H36_07430 [Spirochaetales bacterium]